MHGLPASAWATALWAGALTANSYGVGVIVGVGVDSGMMSCCPTRRLLLVRLLASMMASTVTPKVWAMVYRLSPDLTV